MKLNDFKSNFAPRTLRDALTILLAAGLADLAPAHARSGARDQSGTQGGNGWTIQKELMSRCAHLGKKDLRGASQGEII
jgi:hypothetical protein